MDFLTSPEPGAMRVPPRVTPINDLMSQNRSSKTLSKAVSLHLEGKLEPAARLLAKAIEEGEKDPGLFSALGHIHYELGDYAAASQAYGQLAEVEPLHRTAHFNRAVCLGNLKDWDGAASCFRRATETDASRADAMLGLGISLIHLGRPAEAMTPLEKYLSLVPDHEQALLGAAVALQQTGKHAEAVEQYRKVLARNPRSEEALSNLIAMFLEKKDLASAQRYAAMLAEMQPESPISVEALAALAFQDGDYPTAVRYCRNLSEMAPDRYENWFNLGVAHHKAGNYERAAQAYRQAAAMKSDSAQAHLNLGVALQELNDMAGARACYEKALAIDPNQSGVQWNLALVLEQQGERNWAEKLYARLPENAAEWCDARFRLGYLRLLRGAYASSAEAFEACLGKRQDWPEAYLNAGIAYARLGQPEAARRYFQETLVLRPDSSDAVRGLAALALEQQDFPEAYDLHLRLIELGEHSPELYYNAGLICQKRGQTEDAVSYYQKALQENPEFAEALLNLGHALMAMGKEEEARSFWRRAMREKPELAQTYFEPPTA